MKHQPQHVLNAATLAFAMNSISHRVMDDPYFIDMCKSIAAAKSYAKLPCRKSLRNNVLALAEEKRKVTMA